MGEFHDINTADARYVFGLPVLVCAITFIPWLVSLPEEPLDGKNLPGLITIFIAPLIVFALTSMFAKLSTTVSEEKIDLVFRYGFPQKESAPYSLAKRMLHIQSLAYWQQHNFPIKIIAMLKEDMF